MESRSFPFSCDVGRSHTPNKRVPALRYGERGGFSAMRGVDFWQGAAAGFVSSFAGSAAQGVGIHGWGMVGISAASGGVGAAIAGGKAEEILFGMVQGAMVGVLNHLQGERQKELTIREKVGKLATSLGISVEAKNALIEWAIKGGKAADVEKYLAYSK